MYTITTYSNRLYINEDKGYQQIINDDFIKACDDTLIKYNKMLFSIYNLLFMEKFNNSKYLEITKGLSLFKYLKNKYNIKTPYINSLINEAKGKLESQISNNKNYINHYEEVIKIIEEDLLKLEKTLKNYLKLRDDFIKYRNDIKNNKNYILKVKSEKGCSKYAIKNITFTNNKVYVRFLNKKEQRSSYKLQHTLCEVSALQIKEYGFIDFEYNYLNKKIKKLKELIGKKKFKLNNKKGKLNKLQKIKPIIFRRNLLNKSNSIFKTRKERIKAKTAFIDSKYDKFLISGRCDAKCGNYILKLIYISKTDDFDISISFLNKDICLSHIDFPYQKEAIKNTLFKNTNDFKMHPICLGVIRKYDKLKNKYYYQIKISLDLEATNSYINEDISTGIIGMDFNYKHLDITEIDKYGNIVNCFTVNYDVDGTSHQNALSLRKALNEVFTYANSKHKCVVIEDLDLIKTKNKNNKETAFSCKTKSKKKTLNKIIHSLSYDLYKRICKYESLKISSKLFYINPAFTSVIGKLKYSPIKKLNSHIAASYVIARRALKFKETPIKEQYKLIPIEKTFNEFSMWSYLNKLLNKK